MSRRGSATKARAKGDQLRAVRRQPGPALVHDVVEPVGQASRNVVAADGDRAPR